MAANSLINWVNRTSGNGSNGEPSWYLTTGTSDPFDWYPTKILDNFNTMFEDFWNVQKLPYVLDDAKLPKTNIMEKDGTLYVECAIPFAKKENVKVTLDPLTNGVKIEVDAHQIENDEGVTYHLKEVSRTSFKRSFAISKKFNIKKAKAKFENGVLDITIPPAKDSDEIVLDL